MSIENAVEITLKPWDGITPGGRKCPASALNGLYVCPANGCIYYQTADGWSKCNGKQFSIWCPANSLESHIQRLRNILEV